MEKWCVHGERGTGLWRGGVFMEREELAYGEVVCSWRERNWLMERWCVHGERGTGLWRGGVFMVREELAYGEVVCSW